MFSPRAFGGLRYVDLDRLGQLERQVGGEPTVVTIEVLQSLHHQRRSVVMELEYPVGLDQIIERPITHRAGSTDGAARQRRAVGDESEGRRSQPAVEGERPQPVDVGPRRTAADAGQRITIGGDAQPT